MKTIRELVEEEFKQRHQFMNDAVHYDDPIPFPDIDSMTDEELWEEFKQHAGGAAVG